MIKRLTRKKAVCLLFIIIVLLLLIFIVYKVYTDEMTRREQDAAWEAIQAEHELYCQALPDILKSSMVLGDNVRASVESELKYRGLSAGVASYSFCDSITVTIYNVPGFAELSDKAKYDYMKALINKTQALAKEAKKDYCYLNMSQSEREKISNRYVYVSNDVHVEVYGCGAYSLRSTTDVLYKGNVKVYDPAVQEASKDSADSGNTYRPSGNRTFNNLITDPDDYDDPDDYVEDAWGLDFDDYDEAYEFWENW